MILCNGMLKYFPDHIEDEGKYIRAMFIKKVSEQSVRSLLE